MSTLKDIRTRLGYSQAHMAKLLSITRSYLTKIENTTRKLPVAVYNKLREIEIQMEPVESTNRVLSEKIAVELRSKAILQFEATIENEKSELKNKIEKLENMQLNFIRATNRYNFICKQMQKFSLDSVEYILLDNEKKMCENLCTDTSEIPQQILMIQITSLEQIIAFKSSQLSILKS